VRVPKYRPGKIFEWQNGQPPTGAATVVEGRFPEALEESERARQLDPLSLIIATDHAVILHFGQTV